MATATAEPTTPQTSTKPLKVFRLRGISASVFENHSKNAERSSTFHKVSLQRTYRDGDEFKTTTSFGRDELPICIHLMQQAWAFILDAESKRGQDDAE
ncbi:MAG: hypothetical protein AB7O59_19755 [Pirellulales bacterium]